MLFNSIDFFIFFVLVYSLYLFLSHKGQNRLLLIASYIFYGWWDWRFLSLILFSTVTDYICAIRIEKSSTPRQKKIFLIVSLVVNLGLLSIFKYFNFFIASAVDICHFLGISLEYNAFRIILPVGISFYTFQTLSYTIDVYQGKLTPTKKFLDFALYVSFFPQLVAGPIERARHLLPQILTKRIVRLEDFKQGVFLIFWGLFEKMFVASLLAKIVDPIFSIHDSQNGLRVLIALYAFSFQIFCDFDGYSNIARGLARCMGIEIMINFRLPYIARNPKEFWSRWHISLSGWLRDYLYIPLGGNKFGKWMTLRNLMITMLLGGLWHGASWTFVIWGIYHGVLLVIYRFFSDIILHKNRGNNANSFIANNTKRFVFFHCIVLGWLIFRSESAEQVIQMLSDIIFRLKVNSQTMDLFFRFFLICLPLWLVQFAQAFSDDLMIIYKKNWVFQTAVYAFLTYLIFGWGVMRPEEFIYFQF